MWSHVKAVFRNLLHTQQVESELDDEIASYVDVGCSVPAGSAIRTNVISVLHSE